MIKTRREELLREIKHNVNWRHVMHCSDTVLRIAGQILYIDLGIMSLKMQTISSVLKMALTVQKRTCVTDGDVGLGRSNIRSTVVAKLINDRQAERNLSSQV